MADDMTVRHGGNRRIDRVLAPDFLAGLETRSLAEVRAMRDEAEQEEADLSYVRRLLQGRIDILRAETDRRRGGEGSESLLAALPHILADDSRAPARGLGRHNTVEPSRVDEHRRHVERLAADVGISDVGSQSDEQLAASLDVLNAEEHELSAKRKAIQKIMDSCTAEITRRYREGEADVSALLPEGSADS